MSVSNLSAVAGPLKRGTDSDESSQLESTAVKRLSSGGRPRVQCRFAECVLKSGRSCRRTPSFACNM
eukprot:3950030-Pleurochrysis_carterae.AAC.2